MDSEEFDLFVSLNAQGRRKEAGAAIAAFAASFRDLAARRRWTEGYPEVGVNLDQIRHELYDLCPGDDRVRLALLGMRIDWLPFAIHEWPGGVLYGMNAATLEQFKEIKKVDVHAQDLDREGEHAEFLTEFESRPVQYMARLEASGP